MRAVLDRIHRLGGAPPLSVGLLFAAAVVVVLDIWLVVHIAGLLGERHDYRRMICAAARRHAVPAGLVMAVIRQESDYRAWSAGAAGEIGLMQITAGAVADWERVNGRRVPVRGMLLDPRLNIEIGTWYLGQAMRRWSDYRDAEVLALAEYNAGPGRAAEWAPDDPRENVMPQISFSSTRGYIRNVLEYRQEYTESCAKP